ncbi:MAG: hypothetical protein JXJ18_13910 [Rhodobacteraceae bacterium]|nr:hypothetical protein [Paracoccaceae bacterium]
MRLVAVCAVLVLGPGAAAADAYDGLYRPDAPWAQGWDCRSVGMDGGALAVMNGTFYGVENKCALTNPVPVRGMAATLYDGQCAGEGVTYSERIMLMRSANGIVVIRDGYASALIRCP